MGVVMIRKFGGPEVLELAEVPAPIPGDEQVLIQVHAASVNPVDWRIREAPPRGTSRRPFRRSWAATSPVS